MGVGEDSGTQLSSGHLLHLSLNEVTKEVLSLPPYLKVTNKQTNKQASQPWMNPSLSG